MILVVALAGMPSLATGQTDPLSSEPSKRSAGKALALSLAVPGLGHRYANNGSWGKTGSFFLAADVGILINLVGARWREGDLEESYRTLASSRAGADLDGKSRAFLLSLGQYESSEEFRDVLLRTRQWDRLESAEDPANQWEWSSETDRLEYRELRNDAESMGRRASWLIGALVANRVISGVTAMLSARSRSGTDVSAYLVPEPDRGLFAGRIVLTW